MRKITIENIITGKKISMKINVSHIAKLANLPLRKEEVEKLEKQLEETLSYIENLNEINTDNILPTNNLTGLENISREDVTTPSLSQDQALKNAKSQHNGSFKVEAILEQ